MARSALFYVVLAVVALSFAPQALAFGAGECPPFLPCRRSTNPLQGNIPAYSYLEDKAFRHGDIEDVMANMYKLVGTGFLSRGAKFTGLDLKRVYFVSLPASGKGLVAGRGRTSRPIREGRKRSPDNEGRRAQGQSASFSELVHCGQTEKHRPVAWMDGRPSTPALTDYLIMANIHRATGCATTLRWVPMLRSMLAPRS